MRLLQKLSSTTDPTSVATAYRCVACRTRYEVQYHVCPECRGFCVDPVIDPDDDSLR